MARHYGLKKLAVPSAGNAAGALAAYAAAAGIKPYGDAIMLEILRASEGIALEISDGTILVSILDWARNEGIFLSPEGASVTAAYDKLPADGTLQPTDRVVLFNTGA
jgi:threonine synthase